MKKGKIVALILVTTLVSGLGSSIVNASVNDLKKSSVIEQYVGIPIVEAYISKENMDVTATSFQIGEEASKAIDNNENTMWHTKWDESDKLPQSITVKLGGNYNLSSIKIASRKSGDNGKIQEYNIYAGDKLVKSGDLDTFNGINIIKFDEVIQTDEIRIEVTKGVGGFASIAELDFYEKVGEAHKLFDVNNTKVVNGDGANLNDYINDVQNLEDGTIISRFDLKGTGVQSILGISNNLENAHHFNLWTDGSKLGYEIRNASGNTNASVNVTLNKGINTVAFKVEKNKGYSLFLNGERVKFEASTTTKFLKDIPNLNTIDLGKTDRSTGNEYLFTGNVDFLDFYGQSISDKYILEKTAETKVVNLPLPEGTYLSETQKIFESGDLNSAKFRIPSIITTKKGTTIAATDVRNNHAGDAPANIDAGIRISKDGGRTWEDPKRVIDLPGSASVIDASMVEDQEAGKVFLFITTFPENYGFKNTLKGTGFKEFDNELCMVLYDGVGAAGQRGEGNKYYVKPGGKIFAADGTETNYTVDTHNDLYENGVKVSNTFLPESPLKAFGTAYLTIIESEDEGENWSEPKLISGGLKTDWMKFIGTAPGVGIQVKNGEKKGRLVFPLYYTNSNNFQSSAVMYSDDHGQTWELGESPNDTRDGHGQNSDTVSNGNQLTEAQVVEMPDGQLKMFMRNTGSYVRIATSFDGGETWESDVYEDTDLREPYCQLSVINYEGLIDGKKAVIFANPNAGNRSNGTVRIGLIEENGIYENGDIKYNFDWKYSQAVVPGEFGYSSLTELPNGNVGLFYEGPGSDSMNFIEMNLEYIKADLTAQAPAAKMNSFKMINEKIEYLPGEKVEFEASFDQTVSMFGNKNFTATLGEKEVELNIKEIKDSKKIVFDAILPNDMQNGEYSIEIKAPSDLEVVNVIGKKTDLSNPIKTNLSININKKAETVVVSKIQNLKAEALKANSIKLSWDLPKTTSGLIGYEIYKDGKMIKDMESETTELIIEDLNKSTIYSFKVVAKYSNSEKSKPVSTSVRTLK